MTGRLNVAAAVMMCVAFAPGAAPAGETYRKPHKKLVKLVEHRPSPSVIISPTNDRMLVLGRPALESLADLARTEIGLAGERIDPATNGPSRTTYFDTVRFARTDELNKTDVKGLPAPSRLSDFRWSPDGKRVAFTATGDDGIALYVVDAATARAERVTDERLNAAAGPPCEWLADSARLVCRFVPVDRGDVPVEPAVPAGPVIQETAGEKAPARTYTYLLEDEHDEDLFDHYFTSQLAIVSLDGAVTQIGKPGIIMSAEPSPSGERLLVQTLHRPYSYLVPLYRFPQRTEVWTLAGKLVKRIADLPLAETIPIAFGSVREGRRSIAWRADAPATLHWTEAQDGGDAAKDAKIRDTVYTWKAPFDGKPSKLADLELRYGGVVWGSDELALVGEWWWKTRATRTWMLAPGDPKKDPELLFDHSWEDRYNDPGTPVTEHTAAGTRVLKLSGDGKSLFLIGDGASEDGDRPFLDKLDLETKKTERLYRSAAPVYEVPIRLLDDEGTQVITRRETTSTPPNFCVIDTTTEKVVRRLTKFPHPHPELKGVQQKQIRYERADGVMLTAKLYTPKGWTEKKGALPLIMWAYPREFKSADAAGQVTDSPYRFSQVGWWSPLVWVLRGYAVLEGPTMPIIGEGDAEPNDTYVEQLVSSAAAAIDEVVERGVADRDRIAIGGHSYGAFMTANLLAHSNLFAAGIARSGAYNRTLTPFGFQSEERTLWQAPEVYFTMSPFMHADDIDEPLLLIHGEADPNAGTFPMQSERLYNALKGLGGTARLVMLPHESHGYRARESILHMLWETEQWLDTHVKNRGKAKNKAAKKTKAKKAKKN